MAESDEVVARAEVENGQESRLAKAKKFNNVKVVADDKNQLPAKCVKCRTPIDPDAGFRFCDPCAEVEQSEEKGHAISSSCQLHLQYGVDGNGTVYGGLPDQPDPECSFSDLPIVHYHQNPDQYRRITVTNLCDQLTLMSKRGTTFLCYICGLTHVVLPRQR